jgi:hypothetical protein
MVNASEYSVLLLDDEEPTAAGSVPYTYAPCIPCCGMGQISVHGYMKAVARRVCVVCRGFGYRRIDRPMPDRTEKAARRR